MSASFDVNFAGAICRFQEFGGSSFCDSWQWKLDPYRCERKDSPDLIIRNSNHWEGAPEILRKVSEVQDGFFLRQVFKLADQRTLWRYMRKKTGELLLSFRVSADWSEIVLVEDHTCSGGNMAFEYLCHLMPVCGLTFGMLTFHGALMEHEGEGIMISAPSGTGKTTHARLWRDQKQALILNGDRAVCRKEHGVWKGFGLPWSGTSGEQVNRSVPIKALVILSRSKENQASRIKGEKALSASLSHMLCPAWNGRLVGKSLELLDDFLKEVPVIRLSCRPDADSVEVLARALEEI